MRTAPAAYISRPHKGQNWADRGFTRPESAEQVKAEQVVLGLRRQSQFGRMSEASVVSRIDLSRRAPEASGTKICSATAFEFKDPKMTADSHNAELLALTTEIVSAHVSNNVVAVSDLPALIRGVHASLSKLGSVAVVEVPEQEPAVSVRASVKPDHLVCLEDGKKQKTLKRHLMTSHGLTPEAYRAKWNLPADYPMVSANYASQRREMAIGFGLGRKAGSGAVASKAAKPAAPEAPKKRGRPKLGIATS